MQGWETCKGTWAFDRSLKAIDYRRMMKFVEYRIADPRLLRLIRKWLRVGVSEDGQWC